MGTFCTTTTLDTMMVDTTFNTATTSLAVFAIENAENEIRKRLSERYDVSSDEFQTSTATPPAVKTICRWLSMGYLYENLSRGGFDAFERADRFIGKALDNLDELVNYESNLVNSTGSAISELATAFQVTSTSSDYHDTFDEGDSLGWLVDTDKITDIGDEK